MGLKEHANEEPSQQAFRYRGFVLYWCARFLNAFALQVVSVAVGWIIYDETRDPFHLGLVGLVQFLPALLLVLVTGAVADRFSRRRIMAACLFAQSLCVVALMAFFMGRTEIAGAEQVIWPVFAVLTILGISRAFLGPAIQSLAANLVPAVAFPNAVAWNSSSWQFAMIMGPVVGGLLYGLHPMAPFILAMAFFAAASTITAFIPKPDQARAETRASLETIFAGVRFIWEKRPVLGAITLDMVAVLLGGATALMPAVARDVLDVGPMGLGMLRAAPGIGAVLMAVWLMRNPIRDHAGVILFATVAAYGAAITVFGLSSLVWLSVIALAAAGAADMVSVYIRSSLVQLATPDDVRGRVSAVNQVFIGASNELGEFRAGTMAAFFGIVPAIVAGGLGSIAVAAIWSRAFPELRAIKKLVGR